MDENTTETLDSQAESQLSAGNLQALVDYYRNKCSQLEFEFLQYQLAAQGTIQELYGQLQEHLSAEHTTETQESTD